MAKNENQRVEPKQLGGITGKGFVPGKSGNPSGRPRKPGLVSPLRAKMAEIGPDGRSLEERLVGVLIQEALRRCVSTKNRWCCIRTSGLR